MEENKVMETVERTAVETIDIPRTEVSTIEVRTVPVDRVEVSTADVKVDSIVGDQISIGKAIGVAAIAAGAGYCLYRIGKKVVGVIKNKRTERKKYVKVGNSDGGQEYGEGYDEEYEYGYNDPSEEVTEEATEEKEG